MTAFNDIYFPFDPAVRHLGADLADVPVQRMHGDGPLIQEEYAITPHGLLRVTIADLEAGYRRVYHVGAQNAEMGPV
jgi:hypothetical protein